MRIGGSAVVASLLCACGPSPRNEHAAGIPLGSEEAAASAAAGIVVVDLGTLGGPTSSAVDVTASGLVTGTSLTAAGTEHAFLWSARDGMRDLGSLGGGNPVEYSHANAASVSGVVVGSSSVPGRPFPHAFAWTERDGMLDLGTLGSDIGGGAAIAVNARGDVVGSSLTAEPGFEFPGLQSHAFLWNAATGMRDLGTLGGERSSASAVSANGHVVGASQLATKTWHDFDVHAFLWTERDGMEDLGTLGGISSSANAVSDSGAVVGSSDVLISAPAPGEFPDLGSRPFLWTRRAGMTDLGTLGGRHGAAYALTASGVVVGSSQTASGQEHAFIWTEKNGMRDLGTLGGDASRALAVSTNGTVIGASQLADGTWTGFVWTQKHGMRMPPTLGGRLAFAASVAENGTIAGSAETASGATHAVIWLNASR